MGVTLIPAERHTRNLNVAAYIRVSSTLKAQEESYESQETYYRNKINNTPGWQLAGIYGERLSGTHAENRDEFQRMISDALDRKIDLILCKSVSRWARNTVDGLKAVKLLTGNRVHIIFEQEGVDTRKPGHAFQLNLACSVAQAESESISDNLKWVHRNRARYGIFKAARGRYFGFNTDDGNFTPDENAKHIQYMYQAFVGRKTIAEIVRNLEGVKNNQGNSISSSQIRSILKSEVYKGDLHICKTPSRNVITGELDKVQYGKYWRHHHEPIIDEHTWELAQKRFEEQNSKKGVAKMREEDVLALAEDGLTRKDIAERLGLTESQVWSSTRRLKEQGRLSIETDTARKRQEIVERMEAVYKAVKEGHEMNIAAYLGMDGSKVKYALQKLEKQGRVQKVDCYWVAAQ